MITFIISQCSALQKHVDVIPSIIRTATVSEDASIISPAKP